MYPLSSFTILCLIAANSILIIVLNFRYFLKLASPSSADFDLVVLASFPLATDAATGAFGYALGDATGLACGTGTGFGCAFGDGGYGLAAGCAHGFDFFSSTGAGFGFTGWPLCAAFHSLPASELFHISSSMGLPNFGFAIAFCLTSILATNLF